MWTIVISIIVVMSKILKTLIILLFFALSSKGYSKDWNVVYGTNGDDRLIGTESIDEIYAGEGNDIIISGNGADYIYGGRGMDTYLVDLENTSSFDTVMDFNHVEGDNVLFDFSNDAQKRKKLNIPKKLEMRDVSLDYKRNVIINLTNKKSLTVINVRQSDLDIKIEDEGKYIRLRFEKKF